ncbi:glycosyl transferase family 2 [Xanthomonas citri pv. fuscans]|uniref:Glycosyl transferase family 2 n=1 Tax=Xanthomonas citri pv. fuscans TaxID=366649 RepID=A0AB34Q600_XANCI|nr:MULTISPECIES: glycosyltransferase [Xanthomonas]ATS65745.1 glycosyltransferase [Xanthomonas citri pv. phaseoli var. fuscans]ATS69984.1 glycosyltransferase [Xanthomonas citri pv. phaseoli var. fuscans]ATS74100.1 glycosyltransferase [Xanthomonas citri pv. phaseoli var. fuscans]ATS78275.1 glycosyltransferase [Xanthomonas citri pv. phaseoli var. fuscans]ATS82401.1 glycosyltransferase [Xanthomonas citri pv. phaseoli var. fuscans]
MLSFVIPAHDEAALIGDTLQCLHACAQAMQLDYEVIVVADACEDATAAIARGHGAQVLEVQLRHIAATRNAGAQAAQGERLLFLDADTSINPRVVGAALAALDAGAVGGGARVHLQGKRVWSERVAQAFFGWFFRISGIAPGCFLFCTRAAFVSAGGFDTRYYAGEDVALSRALARCGRFVILRQTVHTSDRKLRSFSKREHLGLLLRFLWRGRRMLQTRDALGFWYRRRR